MSAQRPLGVTDTGTIGLTSDALRVRTRDEVRSGRVGLLALSGITLTTLLVTVAAAGTDRLLPETIQPPPASLAGPFGGASFNIRSGGLIAAMVLMFACYVIAVRTAERVSARAMLLCIGAINVLVLLAPPLLSTDIFSYQMYGHMGALYGFNPYLAGPHALQLDPLSQYVGAKWAYTPSVYGPVFTILSYILAPLSIAASALAYKSIAAISSLGTVALVWNAARLRQVNPVKAVALVGLNPLTVIYGVGGGHNDLLMLVALMAGVYLLMLNRERSSGAMMVVAAAVKVSAILPMLFAVISGHGQRQERVRRGVIIGGAAATAAVAVLTFAVFGTGSLHLPATLVQVQGEGDWHSVPGLLSALGFPTASTVFSVLLAVAFVVIVLWLARRVWLGQLDWLRATGWTTATVLVTTSSLLPWYVAWLMPFAALVKDRRLWRFALVFTGFILTLQLGGYIPAFKEWLNV
ncbi:MAG TPA: polyprenol phosphomannose-dependent alpha 1,6 mannosyltransferase MptB [Solirubrobacteraceae bacterium]|nr:polyprenol phosphomannose-dependent alpha 1,6 mannosyltransferase MptB [Solirubrobacteraceae bacterium]